MDIIRNIPGVSKNSFFIGLGTNKVTLTNNAGILEIAHATVFNPDSADLDFQINSENSYLKFDAGADRLGIGIAPQYFLDFMSKTGQSSYLRLYQEDDSEIGYRLQRNTTAGVRNTNWVNYIPHNSKELRWYNGADLMSLSELGVFKLGTAANYLQVDNGGVLTLSGTAKRVLTTRVPLNYRNISAQGKPTQIQIGAHTGYSLPIFSSDDEELRFDLNVPKRWDGASNITIHVLVALSQAETIGDDFRLNLAWQHSSIDTPLSTAIIDVPVQTNIPSGREAKYDTYTVMFTIDYDHNTPNMLSHDMLSLVLTRIAVVAGTEIAGEIIIMEAHIHYNVDKMFGEPE